MKSVMSQMKKINNSKTEGIMYNTIINRRSRIFYFLLLLAFVGVYFNLEVYGALNVQTKTTQVSNFNILMGRPTDKSITMNIISSKDFDIIVEYGPNSGSYTAAAQQQRIVKSIPAVIELTNLKADNKYYYRIKYKEPSASDFSNDVEYYFRTQRSKGSTYKFTIEADPHLYDKKGCMNLMKLTLANQLNDAPDFMLDLGDTFGDDHNPYTITSAEMETLRLNFRNTLSSVSHSIPFYFCIGNHEGEFGYYLLQSPPNNLAVYSTIFRKKYYPNPFPNGFYTGNTASENYGMGQPENYYAWEWGDALIVVLDAYRPVTVNEKPREWDWSLGEAQFKWFKQTLETSKAKYKLVFIHHVLGQTRGGALLAKLYEWGGYDAKGTNWQFDQYRPGWGGLSIHQLMVKNGVQIFFQGHDHLYAKEDIDGMVYQEVPMPSDSTYKIGMTDNGDAFTGVKIDGSGHLRVTVSPDSMTVDYIKAYLPADENQTNKNGQLAYSYSVKPNITTVKEDLSTPSEFRLEQNYPNPFNPSSVISYRVAAPCNVSLKVYDLLGREVAELVNEYKNSGSYNITFNPERYSLTSGIYYYRLTAGNLSSIKKAIYLK